MIVRGRNQWSARRVALVLGALSLVVSGCSSHAGQETAAADATDQADHGDHPESAATADAAAEHGDHDEGAVPQGEWVAETIDDALFTVDCRFSRRASNDPIVFPGQPGASHSHDFFGAKGVDATSTGMSLLGGETTCEDKEDTASYWVPTLSVDGTPVDPVVVRAYYRAPIGADVRDVVAPPLGLAMISGDHHVASQEGHEVETSGWGCGLRPQQLHSTPPTNCTTPSPLTLQLRFPDCWDGRNLDSPDHQAHVARSEHGTCPSTHPVLMTELQLSIIWPVTGQDGASVTISSGPVREMHGDFLNGWDPDALDRHVELCINAKANCTIG